MGGTQSRPEDKGGSISLKQIFCELEEGLNIWKDIMVEMRKGRYPQSKWFCETMLSTEGLMCRLNYGDKHNHESKARHKQMLARGPRDFDGTLIKSIVHDMVEPVRTWNDIIDGFKKTGQCDKNLIWDYMQQTELKLHKYNFTDVAYYGSSVDPPKPVKENNQPRDLENTRLRHELAQYKYDIQRFKSERAVLKKQVEDADQERNVLLIRLSKVASEKLTHENPNIADLSDKNRPTKLGEMYSELYDNEWTDAFEALTKADHSEIEAIKTLHKTLFHTFNFCKKKSDMLTEKTTDAVNLVFQENNEVITPKDWTPVQYTLPKEQAGDFKRISKHPSFLLDYQMQICWKPKRNSQHGAHANLPTTTQAYTGALWDSDCVPELKPFIKQCIFIGWMMVVQSPPLCFEAIPKAGDAFNTDIYKHYVTSGTTMKYLVWPALRLHKDGPIIAKGVAEAKKSNSS